MTLHTHLYNLLHTGNPGDLEYYLQQCAPGEKILELGCGNGRVTAALSRQGCLVDGLDNNPEMLLALRKKFPSLQNPPETHLEDMRSFALNKTFDKVIIPFNGLLCLLTAADVEKTLRCVKTHLVDGGALLLDMYYVPNDFLNEGEEDEAYIDTEVLDDNGTPIHVYEKTLVVNDPQRFDTSYIFVSNQHEPNEKHVEILVQQRCLYVEQLQSLLEKVGFSSISITADFTNGNINDNTEQVVVQATTPHPT